MTAVHVLVLLASAFAIYVACEWFVNAVEWLGSRLQMGTLAVGTVLAAIGTALPESVVTLVAVTQDSHGKDIGVGAAMGGPLALATIGYAIAGFMMLRYRRRTGSDPLEGVELKTLAGDQASFLAIFVVKVGLGLVVFAWKPWLGLLFFAAYVAYVVREMRRDDEAHDDEGLEALKLMPHAAQPHNWAIGLQTIAALALIFVASHVFVGQLEWAGPAMGISATLTALLLAPIATELPELINATIWLRQGKTQLAVSNISGSMMIQATVPSGIGMIFTPWHFDHVLMLSGAMTMLAIVYLLTLMVTRRFSPSPLAAVGGVYLAFAAGAVALA